MELLRRLWTARHKETRPSSPGPPDWRVIGAREQERRLALQHKRRLELEVQRLEQRLEREDR